MTETTPSQPSQPIEAMPYARRRPGPGSILVGIILAVVGAAMGGVAWYYISNDYKHFSFRVTFLAGLVGLLAGLLPAIIGRRSVIVGAVAVLATAVTIVGVHYKNYERESLVPPLKMNAIEADGVKEQGYGPQSKSDKDYALFKKLVFDSQEKNLGGMPFINYSGWQGFLSCWLTRDPEESVLLGLCGLGGMYVAFRLPSSRRKRIAKAAVAKKEA